MAHVEIYLLNIKIFNILAFDTNMGQDVWLVISTTWHVILSASWRPEVLNASGARSSRTVAALRNKDAARGDRLLDALLCCQGLQLTA